MESEIYAFQAGYGEIRGFDEMGTQRILVVSDQANGFHCNKEPIEKGYLHGAVDKRNGSSPNSNERWWW
ncbi:unnamed protein product [Rhodiola kirilowii]